MAAVAVGIPFPTGWMQDTTDDCPPERPVEPSASSAAGADSIRRWSTSSVTSWAGETWRQRSSSCSGLEAWLAEESQWQQARLEEMPRCPRAFRVNVPSNYPGVQYRRSKNLQNRYCRYAQAGSIVHGLEEDGVWLRVAKNVYLPMVVGGRRVLEPCLDAAQTDPSILGHGGRIESSVKAELMAAAHPSSAWLCAAVPATCNTSPCAVAPRVDMIEVMDSQPKSIEASMCLDDVADASPLSARSLRPSLPGLPRSAPPCLPTRAPSGDDAVDEAERLLAKVVDPFGVME
jgi:hypothetical protein